MFLIVSGYLYGSKEIIDKRRFVVNRVKRVLIPYWIIVIILSFYLAIVDNYEQAFFQLIEGLLNIQGIKRVFLFIEFPIFHVGGLSHCWFLTVIIFCYGAVVIIKGTKLEKMIDKSSVWFLGLAAVCQVILVGFGINIRYFIAYFMGYFLGHLEESNINKKHCFLFITGLTFMLCVCRIYLRTIIDGSWFYNYVVCSWSFIILGLWCCVATKILCHKYKTVSDRIVKSEIWRMVDTLSFPVYLTHYMFLHDPFDVGMFVNGTIKQIITFIFLTIVSSVALLWTTSLIYRIINK